MSFFFNSLSLKKRHYTILCGRWNRNAVYLLGSLFLSACAGIPNPLEKSKVVAQLKKTKNSELVVGDYKAVEDEKITLPLSTLTKEPQIVKLDSKDEALTGTTHVTIIIYILVRNLSQNLYKLFDKKGNFLTTIGAYGDELGEYT